MLVKKKMFCPGSGNELLSTLGGSLECHASSIVLVPLDSNIADTTKGFAFLFSLSFRSLQFLKINYPNFYYHFKPLIC